MKGQSVKKLKLHDGNREYSLAVRPEVLTKIKAEAEQKNCSLSVAFDNLFNN